MRFAVVLTCVLALVTPSCTSDQPTDTDGLATVTQVVDGDTIDVAIGGRVERVRLIGIDTPETKRPDTPVECYGPEATAFTASLLPEGSRVRIERDVVGRDDYGRLLAYVHLVGTGADGGLSTFVNLEIVEQGFARPLTIEPNSTFARQFTAAATRAERAGRGLWAACSA